MLLDYGIAGRMFNIAAPTFMLRCLKAQIRNLTLAGLVEDRSRCSALAFSAAMAASRRARSAATTWARSRSSRCCSAHRLARRESDKRSSRSIF
jgi:hypothetical protein